MAIGLVVKGLLMVGAGILFLLKLRGGTDSPRKPVKSGTCTSCERKTTMRFNYGEFADGLEDAGDLEEIGEFQEFMILESEPFIDPIPEYVPMDDYLEKALERQREKELAGRGKIEFPDRRKNIFLADVNLIEDPLI